MHKKALFGIGILTVLLLSSFVSAYNIKMIEYDENFLIRVYDSHFRIMFRLPKNFYEKTSFKSVEEYKTELLKNPSNTWIDKTTSIKPTTTTQPNTEELGGEI